MTGEALRIIASSIVSVGDVDDIVDSNAAIGDLVDSAKPGSVISAPDAPKVVQAIKRRMGRVDNQIEEMTKELRKLCMEMPIGNPGALGKNIMEKAANSIADTIRDVHQTKGIDPGFDSF